MSNNKTKSVSQVSITTRLPFLPADGHRITTSKSVQSVDIEFIQYTGKDEAMTVAAIRLPAKHAKMLAASIQEQVIDLANTSPDTNKSVSNPPDNATLGNLEGDLGSPHMQGTPKAQGHEADNLSAESAGKDT